MRSKKRIKERIFRKVSELYKLENKQGTFIPGKSYVNYAGRVYDENELINRAKKGDLKSFEIIVKDYENRVFQWIG